MNRRSAIYRAFALLSVLTMACTVPGESVITEIFSTGFEQGDREIDAPSFTRLEDPAGTGGMVLKGEVTALKKTRKYLIPYESMGNSTLHVSFKARSPEGTKAALFVNPRGGERRRFMVIEQLSDSWTEYTASVEIAGNETGTIEIVAPTSWGGPVGSAFLDDIRVTAESEGVPVSAPELSTGPFKIPGAGRQTNRVNLLFITMDDMNYDSVGVYGCPIPGITPNMDRLAAEGFRFLYAYDQTSNCAPSRNAYQNGRYPHVTGNLGFFNIEPDFKPLPEVMRDNGYFTACINKARDSSMNDNYGRFWDFPLSLSGPQNRDAAQYAVGVNKALLEAAGQNKPFYCVVNIADPHKPMFNDRESVEQGYDSHKPSRIYSVKDVPMPAFLPEHPEIHEEVRNYYNSVKRGDDCVGAVLDMLEQTGYAGNTAVIFVSDHGMPLPYAKSSLYPDGVRTPWIIRWPGRVKPGLLDSDHLVSAIDFMPTVLDVASIPFPDGVQGRSVLPIIMGEDDPSRDRVFTEFNDNAGGMTFPMRAVHKRDHLYIFNAWATGENRFTSAATWHVSEKVLKRMADDDPDVRELYEHLVYRTVEEYYDLTSDPHALVNLIDDPARQPQIDALRQSLREWMVNTDDYLLDAYDVRDDLPALQRIYVQLDADALERAETLQWKRYRNRAGGTGGNTRLYRKP